MCNIDALGPDKSDLFAYAIESIPQLDYPPSWPVNATCAKLMQADDLVAAAGEIASSYAGFDGKSCLKPLPEGPGGVPGDGPGPGNWGYQSCTENIHEFSARTIRNFTFDLKAIDAICTKLFNGTVTPDPMALTRRFGGFKIPHTATNLIWSNGLRDPWHGGGFLTPLENSKNHWILMPNGAHHVDLRAATPQDTPDITDARNKEEAIIQGWLNDFAEQL